MNTVPDPIEPQPELHCSHYIHELLARNTDAAVCSNCGKRIFRTPEWKCKHGAMAIGCALCNEF